MLVSRIFPRGEKFTACLSQLCVCLTTLAEQHTNLPQDSNQHTRTDGMNVGFYTEWMFALYLLVNYVKQRHTHAQSWNESSVKLITTARQTQSIIKCETSDEDNTNIDKTENEITHELSDYRPNGVKVMAVHISIHLH